jgi:hypothetical protein
MGQTIDGPRDRRSKISHLREQGISDLEVSDVPETLSMSAIWPVTRHVDQIDADEGLLDEFDPGVLLENDSIERWRL